MEKFVHKDSIVLGNWTMVQKWIMAIEGRKQDFGKSTFNIPETNLSNENCVSWPNSTVHILH